MKRPVVIFAASILVAGAAFAAGPLETNPPNPCMQWKLSEQASRDCREAWMAAKTEAEREEVRLTFGPTRAKYPENANDPRRPNWPGDRK